MSVCVDVCKCESDVASSPRSPRNYLCETKSSFISLIELLLEFDLIPIAHCTFFGEKERGSIRGFRGSRHINGSSGLMVRVTLAGRLSASHAFLVPDICETPGLGTGELKKARHQARYGALRPIDPNTVLY